MRYCVIITIKQISFLSSRCDIPNELYCHLLRDIHNTDSFNQNPVAQFRQNRENRKPKENNNKKKKWSPPSLSKTRKHFSKINLSHRRKENNTIYHCTEDPENKLSVAPNVVNRDINFTWESSIKSTRDSSKIFD